MSLSKQLIVYVSNPLASNQLILLCPWRGQADEGGSTSSKTTSFHILFKRKKKENKTKIQPSFLDDHLNRLSSSASSSVQPWVQPENANISISYLRCNATNGPLSWSNRTNFSPKASISGVNFNAWKFTRHLSFWSSRGIPLFASLVSVLLKCITWCFLKRGRICNSNPNALKRVKLNNSWWSIYSIRGDLFNYQGNHCMQIDSSIKSSTWYYIQKKEKYFARWDVSYKI